jgi:hypothetical protein
MVDALATSLNVPIAAFFEPDRPTKSRPKAGGN